MKRISDEQKSDIEDAATAGLLGALPPAVVEKDLHITDVLRILAQIEVTHIAHQKGRKKGDPRPASIPVATRLVFAGGTCLSKAHGLVERMSEDIDIKVVLDNVPEGYVLQDGHTDRARLGNLHRQVERLLTDIGFQLVTRDDEDNPVARDSRRYYCLSISYAAHFQDVSGALRPELKLELIHRSTVLAAEMRDMGYMFDGLVPRVAPLRFSMACITVAETLAEKVLSLLRRCAWNWDGHQRGEYDAALVRHVYDVWRIAEIRPDALAAARQIFAELVRKEVEEFRGQHPGFDQDAYSVLRRTLASAAVHEGLKTNFEQGLKPLLYAARKPEFETCYAVFARTAEQLLNLPPSD